MNHAMIKGTGSYLPKNIVTNYDLEKTLETTHKWIFGRTGIAARHVVSGDECTSMMAIKAAEKALANAKVDENDIDMILVATCTPDMFFPSMACHVQHGLNIKKSIPAMDISAACSGFVYALDVANQYIMAGTAKNILVIGSETMSRSLDWEDRGTCVLFGDGAAAAVVSSSSEKSILASILHAKHDSAELLQYVNRNDVEETSFIQMQGKEIFKLAVNLMGGLVDEVLEKAGLCQSDIDWLVPHQANTRIISAIAKKLNMPMDKVVLTIETQGNTSAASIPIALDCAIQNNQVKRGDTILIESFGAGLTWGAMIIRY